MPAKTTTKKTTTTRAALPAGVKPAAATRRTTLALRRALNQDRGIASGGRNTVHRSTPAVTR